MHVGLPITNARKIHSHFEMRFCFVMSRFRMSNSKLCLASIVSWIWRTMSTLKVSTCTFSPASHGKVSTVMHIKFIRVISFVPFKNFVLPPDAWKCQAYRYWLRGGPINVFIDSFIDSMLSWILTLSFLFLHQVPGCELGYNCDMGDVRCLRKQPVGCNPVQYALMCRLNISDPYF